MNRVYNGKITIRDKNTRWTSETEKEKCLDNNMKDTVFMDLDYLGKKFFLTSLKQPHKNLGLFFRISNKNLEDKERVFDVLKYHWFSFSLGKRNTTATYYF